MEKTITVPELRFPEFSDNGKFVAFSAAAEAKSHKFDPKKEHTDVKCIELEHISSETGHLLGFVNGLNSGSIKNKFDKGDVLFGKLRPYLRKHLLAPFKGVCSSEIWVLKSKEGINEFLYYLVQTEKFLELANISSGSKMPRADWNIVSKGKFCFPSLQEQQRIAAFLTAVDDKIEQLTKKKALLEQYKKGMMQQIFNQEIRFKDENGRHYAAWEWKQLGEISTIKRGASPRPISDLKWFSDESNIGWVRISDVTKATKFLLKTQQYLSAEGISKSRLVKEGNLIMSICATIGKPIYTSFDVCIHDGFVVFDELTCNREYLYYYLDMIQLKWYKYGQPGSQVNLNSDIVAQEEVPQPSLKEQTKIANFLSALDDKIKHVDQQVELTKQYKKGLLQQMFV